MATLTLDVNRTASRAASPGSLSSASRRRPAA